ncbi:MAG: hypothetical protein GC180_09675 [Bacteroidetes bacterium]|nr:hypothetical protein [Bacteroidota bacterium]
MTISKNCGILSAVLSVLIFASCKKDKTTTSQPENSGDLLMGQELVISEQYFGDLKSIADEAESGSLSSFKSAGCATVTLDQSNKKIKVDFGSSNCLCKDNRFRRGVLDITYTKTYWDSGNVITITPSNYYVNDYGLNGTKMVTNLGLDANSNPHWQVDVNGTVIKPLNGGTVGWICNRIMHWVAGSGTPANWTDDAWEMEGSATLTTSSNAVYNLDIQSNLHRALACAYIDKGVLQISKTGITPRIIDYGNGTCDNDATLTVGSVSIPFKLK